MRINLYLSASIALLLFACGPKVGKKEDSAKVKVLETMAYTSKINSDKSFKEEKSEGALTDAEGYMDVGKFEYTTFFDERTKELVRITNLEITDRKVLESYYFKDKKLYCILVMDPYNDNVKVGESIQMVTIFPNDANQSERAKLLLEKAARFYSAFKNNH